MTHRLLLDLKLQNAAIHRLFGDIDCDCHITGILEGLLQGGPRSFDVLLGPARAHIGVDRPLDRFGRKHIIALHLKGANLKGDWLPRALRGPLRMGWHTPASRENKPCQRNTRTP